MQEFLNSVLQKIQANPELIGDAFGPRLSHHEELMLASLEEEIGLRVEAILDRALAGNSQEIALTQNDRQMVMEMTAIRRAIKDLIRKRGSLAAFADGLN